MQLKKFIKKYKYEIAIIFFVALALVLRLINLSSPNWQVFDEIYYYNWGRDYLTGTYFFDVHPPTGKLFISLGQLVFGNNLFASRFFQAIAGTISIYLVYLFTDRLTKNKNIALLSAILMFFETSMFVESRLSLINIFIIPFVLLSFIYYLKWLDNKRFKYIILSLIFLSISATVKWSALFNAPVLLIFTILDQKASKLALEQIRKNKIIRPIIIVLSFIIPYLLIFLFDYFKGDNLIQWHIRSFSFHHDLQGSHPYASQWYQWLFMVRPIWLEFKQTLSGHIIGILEVGNPFIIIPATISIVFTVWQTFFNQNKKYLLIILAIIINLIPWIFISRESFYYHFIPIIPFTIVSLSIMINYFLSHNEKTKYLAYFLIISSVWFFIWYWPMINGLEIPFSGYEDRVISSTWR